MQNKFTMLILPLLEIWSPPAVAAVMSPIVKKYGLEFEVVDLNVMYHEVMSSEEWDEFVRWCTLTEDTPIRPDLLERYRNLCRKVLSKLDCRYLGISAFSYYSIPPARVFLEILNEEFKDREYETIIGGNAMVSVFRNSTFGKYLMEENLADNVVFGEGEEALMAFLENKPWPGLNNPDFQQIYNIDLLPIPDYSELDINRYKLPRIIITGSRGCVRKCTFCDIGQSWPKFSYRSAESLVEEIRRHVHETGITKFEFSDSLINGSATNFARFNEQLIEAKAKDPALQDVSYIGQFICRSQRSIKPEFYELMHYGGCEQITTGIESFSERVRFHMKKKFSDADIEYHLEQSAYWGIPNILLMIVGYPTETLKDHNQNLKALVKYQDYAKRGVIYMIRWGLTMSVIQNTPINDYTEALGLEQLGDSNRNWISASNPDLTLRERIRRRLELHDLSTELGYAMPNSRRELAVLLKLADLIGTKGRVNFDIPIVPVNS